MSLSGLRTQAVCRLHRELQILIPGGASRALTAAKAKALLGSVRPRDEVGKVRKSLGLDQLADLVAIDKRLKDIGDQIKTVAAETRTSVTEVRGVGPVVAAIVLGEVRDVSRFPTKHHFASYNGTAPTTWGSAGDARPCVNLHGNRRLNHALHIAAIVQLRFDCDGQRYYQRKIADGKTPKEARRCLKRRISDAIYHQLVADTKAGERGHAALRERALMPRSGRFGGCVIASVTSRNGDLGAPDCRTLFAPPCRARPRRQSCGLLYEPYEDS